MSILGATGSIGRQTAELIAARPDAFAVVAVTAGRNARELARLARTLGAEIAVVSDEAALPTLRTALAGSGIAAAGGRSAVIESAGRPADWVMSAIVGIAGLEPGLAALRAGATLALANKESLVCAGPLLLTTAAEAGARILPVDSEHSAIFQALVGEDPARVERVVITASGGAFRDWPLESLPRATPAEAATHPNWSMGQRITIDSATCFNKALEVIEAKEFFGFQPDAIDVVVHPESLVHALVGFRDGALMAHLGTPDMRHAIGYALNWPDRAPLPVARLDLAAIGQLSFRPPDEARYPALRLAREVMGMGGLSGAVFNGAKEHALDAFIEGRIGFTRMADLVADVLDDLSASRDMDAAIDLDNVANADHVARQRAEERIAAG